VLVGVAQLAAVTGSLGLEHGGRAVDLAEHLLELLAGVLRVHGGVLLLPGRAEVVVRS
jgi:hypothetical protein